MGTEMTTFMAGGSGRTAAVIVGDRNAALAAAEGTGTAMVPRNPEWWQFFNPKSWSSIIPNAKSNNIFTLLKGGKFTEYFRFLGGVETPKALNAASGAAGLGQISWYRTIIGTGIGLKFTGYGLAFHDIFHGAGVYDV